MSQRIVVHQERRSLQVLGGSAAQAGSPAAPVAESKEGACSMVAPQKQGDKGALARDPSSIKLSGVAEGVEGFPLQAKPVRYHSSLALWLLPVEAFPVASRLEPPSNLEVAVEEAEHASI